MATDELTEADLRTLVISTLDREPDATFDRVHAYLRTREGRALESSETDRLHDAYDAEVAHPTGTHRVGAEEAAAIAMNQPFRPRGTEIAGLVAGLIPFIFHLPTTSPGTTSRTTGATVAGGSYDPVAMVGGFVAIILGLIAARQASRRGSRWIVHLAIAGVIVLLGVYQSLLGLGVLHQLGLFRAA
jgi:hypothetical protein